MRGLKPANLLSLEQFQFVMEAIQCAQICGNVKQQDGDQRHDDNDRGTALRPPGLPECLLGIQNSHFVRGWPGTAMKVNKGRIRVMLALRRG